MAYLRAKSLDLSDSSLTENTRASYPIDFIDGFVPSGKGVADCSDPGGETQPAGLKSTNTYRRAGSGLVDVGVGMGPGGSQIDVFPVRLDAMVASRLPGLPVRSGREKGPPVDRVHLGPQVGQGVVPHPLPPRGSQGADVDLGHDDLLAGPRIGLREQATVEIDDHAAPRPREAG